MTRFIIITSAGLLLFATAAVQAAPRELDDAEMDAVCAGADAAEVPALHDLTTTSLSVDNSINSLSLSDHAQQNLTSFVNILAVHSAVQVLLNVNVAINSDIGSVTQGNAGTQTH